MYNRLMPVAYIHGIYSHTHIHSTHTAQPHYMASTASSHAYIHSTHTTTSPYTSQPHRVTPTNSGTTKSKNHIHVEAVSHSSLAAKGTSKVTKNDWAISKSKPKSSQPTKSNTLWRWQATLLCPVTITSHWISNWTVAVPHGTWDPDAEMNHFADPVE